MQNYDHSHYVLFFSMQLMSNDDYLGGDGHNCGVDDGDDDVKSESALSVDNHRKPLTPMVA